MGQLAARALQVRPDEPLELLQLPGLADQQVLGHRIEFVGLVDGLADVLDDAVVDQVQRGQVRLDGVAADRVVIPVTVPDDRARRAFRRSAQRRDALGDVVGKARTASTCGSIISWTPMKFGPTTFQ